MRLCEVSWIKKRQVMEKIKTIVNNPLFKIGMSLAVACILVFEKMPLYAGIAVGIAIREFLLAFKKWKKN